MAEGKKPRYIDIGANLTSKKIPQTEKLVREALDAGVSPIIITGCSLKGSQEALAIVHKYPQYELYCTVGIHPHNAKQYNRPTQGALNEMHKDPKVVAVGECGLDYNRMFSSKEDQIRCFRAQIEMAVRLNKPMFLHDREAFPEFGDILEEYVKREGMDKVRGVVHCFTGTVEEIKKYVELGFYIGITGWICDERRNKSLLEAIHHVPNDRLMVETDSPYLNPTRKGNNVPKNTVIVLDRLANELKMEHDELAKICYENTRRLFRI